MARKKCSSLLPHNSDFSGTIFDFWHVSYRASKVQANATNHIKIGQLVWELWHFFDKWPKLEWENQTSGGDWHPTPHNLAFSWSIFDFFYMYHIELEKCKRLPPTTSKSDNSFGSYDASKTSSQNLLFFKLRFFKHFEQISDQVNFTVFRLSREPKDLQQPSWAYTKHQTL